MRLRTGYQLAALRFGHRYHLYRIAQEALNNALKHSGAKKISIMLSRSPEGLILEIKDNGKGFNSSHPDPSSSRSGGMGLHIMEYRARLIGGNLHLHSD